MILIVIATALNYGQPREMIQSLCKRNSLFLSGYGISNYKYKNMEVAKQKMLMQKKKITLERGGKEF